MKTIIVALAVVAASLSVSAPAVAQDCKGAYKKIHNGCAEQAHDRENERNGAGSVSQTGGRTANSSKG